MTEHERRMPTLSPSTMTRRFGALALLGGMALSLAVTVTAAPIQAADGSAKAANDKSSRADLPKPQAGTPEMKKLVP